MENITYISAGAGSGKTYKLTHELARLFVEDANLRPKQIIMTTFTRKAAAELMNRTRELLCKEGKYDTADRLDKALIGTIHSIGYELVSKYWGYLGLSPKLNILSRDNLESYIKLTIGDTATDDDLNFFHEIAEAFEAKKNNYGKTPLDWKANLSDIIVKAHDFGVSDYDICIAKSKELIDIAYDFGKTFPEPDVIVDNAIKVLDQLITKCQAITDRRSLEKANSIISAAPRLKKSIEKHRIDKTSSEESHEGTEYLKLLSFFLSKDWTFISGKTDTSAYQFPELEELKETCNMLVYCKAAQELMKEYVDRIFGLAKEWEESYAEYKKRHSVLDFNDIEGYLCRLLNIDEVRDEIKQSYKYLMVDEFQDCNSVQIEIFKKLAGLMKHTWWVGDSKQSIYAFRGANTALVDKVTSDIHNNKNGCTREKLRFSYRSVPGLVDFTNKIFRRVLGGKSKVHLKPKKKKCKTITPVRFINIPLTGNPKMKKGQGIANMIASMIGDAMYGKICTKLSDYAVLARKQSEVGEIVLELRRLGIPASAKTDILSSREWKLLSSILTLCEHTDDYLSMATISHLATPGHTTTAIIDSKLEYDKTNIKGKKGWLSEVPLIAAAIKFASANRHLSVSTYVKAIIKELGLESYSDVWPDGACSIWVTLIAKAEDYEAKSIVLGINPTLHGFVKDENFETPSVAEKDAVQVMTYHGAKGLEWPVTILCSLDDDHIQPKTIVEKEIYNVSTYKDCDRNIITLLPQVSCKTLDAVVSNLVNSGHVARCADKLKMEEARLLYVGVTRASHQLVLVTHAEKGIKPYNWFWEMGLPDKSRLLSSLEEISITNAPLNIQRSCILHPCATDFKHRDPLHVSPSLCKAVGSAEKIAETGERFSLTDKDVAKFGSCVHQIYCGLERNHTKEFVQSLLNQYGVKASPNDIIEVWDKFVGLLTSRYGKATSLDHELAFQYANDGQIVTGSIDLVWNTANGCVLVDYKTFPGKIGDALNPSSAHYAGRYKGQLDCYATALQKAGRKVLDSLIFYPSLGLVVRVI